MEQLLNEEDFDNDRFNEILQWEFNNISSHLSEEEFKVTGNITISAGFTQLKKGDAFSQAFDRMDKALYKAKSEGRNCIRSDRD